MQSPEIKSHQAVNHVQRPEIINEVEIPDDIPTEKSKVQEILTEEEVTDPSEEEYAIKTFGQEDFVQNNVGPTKVKVEDCIVANHNTVSSIHI